MAEGVSTVISVIGIKPSVAQELTNPGVLVAVTQYFGAKPLYIWYQLIIIPMASRILCWTVLLIAVVATVEVYDPVILFHGMGDQCSNKGMGGFTQLIGKELNTYSVCV